jgi:hypothetical protein
VLLIVSDNLEAAYVFAVTIGVSHESTTVDSLPAAIIELEEPPCSFLTLPWLVKCAKLCFLFTACSGFLTG